MAKDYLNIAPSPAGEQCEQLGDNYDAKRATAECRALAHQLVRLLGEPPFGAYFQIKTFPHDFGSYKELCVVFNDEDEAATDYAYKCENELPELWDDEAIKELEGLGYSRLRIAA